MPRRSSPSPLLNLPLLIVILPVIALFFLFFALSSLLSLASHKNRLLTNTTVIKSNWDSLYIFLLLLTILCGVFARRNDDESTSNEDNPGNHNKLKRHSVSNAPWFADDFSGPKIYADTDYSSPLGGTATTATGYRLKMGSSSCPDLMQDSFWKTPDDLSRFFDDFEINSYRSPIHHRGHQNGVFEGSHVKDIPVDTFLTRHESQVPLPPPEPPRRRRSSTTGLPPLPKGVNNLYEDNVNNGGQSPLVAIPPLSPPPPCQMPGSQFVIRGDFVETRSAQSSRCSSPNSEGVDKESIRQTVNKTDGMDGIGGPSFCPSPDVNMKADTFIARLRDGWRLEKINSLREKGSVDQVPGTDPAKL
ncbi:hypothetical protein SADUNF_Sadunf06G0120200 [Salix dunnii]|uniref:Hydroxyproline-rich glycoprotein family protein n=1 Tax=Salix dunnii TaxID=1413687 RepID=A0A835K3X9_9ROSI|nr:hypothetical protein SADUNF_Sadunf06G0120200 [Salix dunnii]